MKLRVKYRRSALADAESARDWYEAEAMGLGTRFIAVLNRSVRRILEFPEIGQEIFPDIRRIVVPVFRYRVYYTIESEMAIILAVHHPARNVPNWDELT